MRKPVIFLCFLMSVGTLTSYGQDTLILLNGDVRVGKITHSDSVLVTYNYQKRGKTKTRTLATELIFSTKKANSIAQIIYVQNRGFNHQLSVRDMEVHLFGMHDAKSNYKSPWTFWGGVVFNAGVGYLLHDNFWAASGPLVYTVVIGTANIKVNPSVNRPAGILRNPLYQEGYLKVARSAKVYKALTGSLTGLIIGITVGNAAN